MAQNAACQMQQRLYVLGVFKLKCPPLSTQPGRAKPARQKAGKRNDLFPARQVFSYLIEQLLTVQVLLPDVISTPYSHWPTVPLDNFPLLTSHLKIAARFTEPELD
jgi:hypothetical protein